MDTDEVSVYLIPIPCLLLAQRHTALTPPPSVFFLNMFCGFGRTVWHAHAGYYVPNRDHTHAPCLGSTEF